MKSRFLLPQNLALCAIGAGLFVAIYFLIFFSTGTPFGWALADAAANVIPLVLAALVTQSLVRTSVLQLPLTKQILVHALSAPAFALTWYSVTVVLLGFFHGLPSGNFDLTGFSGQALVWQSFQGLLLYGLVAAACYAHPRTQPNADPEARQRPAFDRYLVRDGDGICPITIDAIVTITRAQDYSEVATSSGRHLVRLSLGQFEERLDNSTFLRVHRSAIINVARLARAEPAGGGRMLALMDNGDTVPISRTGATLLRSFVL